MISLTKLAKPKILADNALAWTAIVLAKTAANQKLTKAEKTRYNHADVKAQLVAETHGKCAYCESKIRHISPGDIEHALPKSVEPSKWFEWDNLTLACSECNRRKGTKVGPFIDPYSDNPADHLDFHGPFAWTSRGSVKGMYTEGQLELNRLDLFERRTSRLKGLLKQIDVISLVKDPSTRDVLKRDFLKELTADREYAAMARSLAAKLRQEGIL